MRKEQCGGFRLPRTESAPRRLSSRFYRGAQLLNMARNHDNFYYLCGMLEGYFHQDCHDDGETNEDIVDEYIKTSWPYERLGLRADIQRFLHRQPEDAFDAMLNFFR